MIEIIAPTPSNNLPASVPTVFLAGSIEMDKAAPWQRDLISQFLGDDIVFFNPRRSSWDSTWAQTTDNPQFFEQVNWELDHLAKCDYIFMYLQAGTKSPISLLELGIYATNQKMVVVVEDDFWRVGNVEIVCERFLIPYYNTLDAGIEHLRNRFGLGK